MEGSSRRCLYILVRRTKVKIIRFDYRQERLHTGKAVIRPVAKVYLLRSGPEWIAEYFYIDSGADYTLIPYRMGRFFLYL